MILQLKQKQPTFQTTHKTYQTQIFLIHVKNIEYTPSVASSGTTLKLFSIETWWQVCLFPISLSHWGRDKMAAIFQTTFSNAFLWMKMCEFRLRFHWILFPINNISALVQIMAWRRPGDKPLSEPMMVSLLTHICVTRPQWVNTLGHNEMVIFLQT